MTAAQIRTFLLAVGLLVAAFGVISVFTPRGFSWSMEITGLLLATPWLAYEGRGRGAPDRGATAVPSWHPEADS